MREIETSRMLGAEDLAWALYRELDARLCPNEMQILRERLAQMLSDDGKGSLRAMLHVWGLVDEEEYEG